jgi:hypothetical protein
MNNLPGYFVGDRILSTEEYIAYLTGRRVRLTDGTEMVVKGGQVLGDLGLHLRVRKIDIRKMDWCGDWILVPVDDIAKIGPIA